MKSLPSPEERIWAVLAHLSALAFGMGILLPIIGWSEQRRKSKYASFHCLQALGYQSLGYTVWILSVMVIMIVFLILFTFGVTLAIERGSAPSTASAAFGVGLGVTFFLLFGVYFVLPLVAVVSCALGRDFHYPIMGRRLARYIGYEQTESGEANELIEEHEDRWVAAMGHFSVIMLLWGILAPLTTWILQGKRSLFLKFQSIQTVVYQVLATVLYFGSGAIYLFGFVALMLAAASGGGFENNSPLTMIGGIIFIVSMLVAALVVLIMPLLHILGQWAGYRVLKGDNYRYPIIGGLVEKRFAPKAPLVTGDSLSLEGKSS